MSKKFVVKGGQDVYNGNDALGTIRYREDARKKESTGRHQIFLNQLLDKASECRSIGAICTLDLIEIMSKPTRRPSLTEIIKLAQQVSTTG